MSFYDDKAPSEDAAVLSQRLAHQQSLLRDVEARTLQMNREYQAKAEAHQRELHALEQSIAKARSHPGATLETQLQDKEAQVHEMERKLESLREMEADLLDRVKEAEDDDGDRRKDHDLTVLLDQKRKELKELERQCDAAEELLAVRTERKEQVETMTKRLLERLIEKEEQLGALEKKFEEMQKALKKEISRSHHNLQKLDKKLGSLEGEINGKDGERISSPPRSKRDSATVASQDSNGSKSTGADGQPATKKSKTKPKLSPVSSDRESPVSPRERKRDVSHRRNGSSGSEESHSSRHAVGRSTSTVEDKRHVKKSSGSRKELNRSKSIDPKKEHDRVSPKDKDTVVEKSRGRDEKDKSDNTKDKHSRDQDKNAHGAVPALETIIRCQRIIRRYLRRKNQQEDGDGHTVRFGMLVKAFSTSEQSKRLRQRNAALREVLDTEVKYLASLKALDQVYITPMRRRRILTESEMDYLFSQIEVICEITEILKDKMQERLALWPAVQKFADIFKDTSPLMKLYYRYIFNFQDMQARIDQLQHQNSEFREFLEKATANASGQSLLSFLIMPVQRLPRYELLLKALLKLTDESHVDYENLATAVDKVVSVNQYINTRKKNEDIKLSVKNLLSKKSSRKLHVQDAKKFLKITLEQARGLTAVDSNGLSDPFAELIYEDDTLRTKIQFKTLTPQWREDFVIVILPQSPPTFTITIWDYDRIGSNTLIGSIEFRISDFILAPEKAGWFPLAAPTKSKRVRQFQRSNQIGSSDSALSAPSSPNLEQPQGAGEIYLSFVLTTDT